MQPFWRRRAGAVDGRNPGSVLVFPIQRAGSFFTILSVTNSALNAQTPTTLGGGTNISWKFLNVTPGATSLLPQSCSVLERDDYLTPGDTKSALAGCLNASSQEGFCVVSAQDPNFYKTEWAHDFLIGSELVLNPLGGIYIINAIPFESPQLRGSHTDNDDPFGGVGMALGDGDGQIDFDGVEYEGVPDHLYADNFLAASGSSLTLLNLSGGLGLHRGCPTRHLERQRARALASIRVPLLVRRAPGEPQPGFHRAVPGDQYADRSVGARS